MPRSSCTSHILCHSSAARRNQAASDQ